jgi:D-alanine-D-alanine ligase
MPSPGSRQTVVVLHGRVPPEARPDEQDVLVEVEAVCRALRGGGYEAVPVALSLDLRDAASRIRKLHPLAVFNLVESVEGHDRLLYLATTLLDFLAVPYTGTGPTGMFLASNKLLAKRLLREAGIATAPWTSTAEALASGPDFDPPYIVKSVWDNASWGLDRVFMDRERLREHLLDLAEAAEIGHRATGATDAEPEAEPGPPAGYESALFAKEPGGQGTAGPTDLFVESYVDGREFNLSLLPAQIAGQQLLEVLPPAEMLFVDYPPEKPRIVGYAAKWDPSSFDYRHTLRRFDFEASDEPLLRELRRLATASCARLDVGGYARVDFRVDTGGRPWVLEVNPNPCLSPDAGLAAAACRAGLEYEDLVKRILAAALSGARQRRRVPVSGARAGAGRT